MSEAHFRALADTAPDGVVLVDREGRILVANAAFERLFGYGPQELLGQPIERLVPEGAREIHLALRQAYHATPSTRPMGLGLDLRGRRKDGSEVAVDISLSPLEAETGPQVIAIVRDATERRMAQRTARLQAITQALSEAATPEQVAAAVLVEGVPALGAQAGLLVLLGPDGAMLSLAGEVGCPEDLVEAWRTGRLGSPPVVALVAREGQPFWVESAAELLARHPGAAALQERLGYQARGAVPLVAHGRVIAVLGFAYATARTFPEEDRAFATALAHAAAQALERARLLEAERQAHAEAALAVRTRDELLSSVTHDLRGPLALIRGQVGLLRRRARRSAEPAVEGLQEGLARIEVGVARATAHLDELADVARLQIGRPLTLHVEAMDLVALLGRLVEEYQEQAERHRLRVEAGEPTLVGAYDSRRLERVFANLLDNAIKYSPDGGDVVVQVARAWADDGAWAVVRVRDRGVGIPAEDLPRLFEQFFRASNVVGRMDGSGIGLAAARQIVEQHGGTVDVESVEGCGTTFTVRLPLG